MANPFGRESRVRILKQHLADSGTLTPTTAWKFIYQELLWIDGSTGLAHLYESDKAQPGRPWYDRTVVFTNMLCEKFGDISREELKQRIDQLFRACLLKLLAESNEIIDKSELVEALTSPEVPSELTDEIRLALENTPSDSETYTPDAELVAEFIAILIKKLRLPENQAQVLAKELVERARFYFTVERKRQNVLGEGFEDLLQLLMLNVSTIPNNRIIVRKRANLLPGFANKATTRERIEAPDIAIVSENHTELLASVKWSLRHDRQKQLSDELDCYVDLLTQKNFPRYVLITSEYDPGRLVNTDGLNRRGQKIDCIYHINLELLLGVLHDHDRVKDLRPLIEAGRLRSIEDFLKVLSQKYGTNRTS